MALRAPALTLAAVAALGAGLFVVNVNGSPAPAATAASAATAAAAAEPTTAPPLARVIEPKPAPPVVQAAVWAGRSAAREITVAVAVKDGKAVAYVCDGKKIESWLTGTLAENRLTLTGPDGARLEGTATVDKVVGTVLAAGKTLSWTARTVKAPEGLYEGRTGVRGVVTKIGWIVVDGIQTGLKRDGGGRVGPAPILDPANPGDVTVDGSQVTVRTGTDLVGS